MLDIDNIKEKIKLMDELIEYRITAEKEIKLDTIKKEQTKFSKNNKRKAAV